MIRQLWLDDERDPVEHGHAGWTWIKTGEEFVQHLCTGDLSEVEMSLDHDLGSGRMTGYDVIVWIEREVYNGRNPPRRINLHTQNPVGRERMRAARSNLYKIHKDRQ